VAPVLPLLRLFPGVLTVGARFSGKAISAHRVLADSVQFAGTSRAE
jgi:hypothetical protein